MRSVVYRDLGSIQAAERPGRLRTSGRAAEGVPQGQWLAGECAAGVQVLTPARDMTSTMARAAAMRTDQYPTVRYSASEGTQPRGMVIDG